MSKILLSPQDIKFNYIGQIMEKDDPNLMILSNDSITEQLIISDTCVDKEWYIIGIFPSVDTKSLRSHLIEIEALIKRDQQLVIHWIYSEDVHRNSTIDNTCICLKRNLLELISLCNLVPLEDIHLWTFLYYQNCYMNHKNY